MNLQQFIREMPKVELHVHIEGAIQPETLLTLAQRNNVDIPAKTIAELREWYRFTDFLNFLQVYFQASACIQTPDDIEFIAKEFLKGQAAQNIRYTEGTWTALTHYKFKGIALDEQLAALNRGRDWARSELGVDMGIVIDLSRSQTTHEESMEIVKWAVKSQDKGVVAFGIGGAEDGYPPSLFKEAFEYATANGLPNIPHAGEVAGAESMWDAIHTTQPRRIYHGVRALEDAELVAYLRDTQMPLDICPTSNICLGVVPDMGSHMLPQLLDAGLYITINSDDPPMFNTTLTNEFEEIADTFGYDDALLEKFILNAVDASLLPDAEKATMRTDFIASFQKLRQS